MLRSASYTDFFVLEDKIIQYIKLSSDKIRTSDWSVGVDETKSNIPSFAFFAFTAETNWQTCIKYEVQGISLFYSNLDL